MDIQLGGVPAAKVVVTLPWPGEDTAPRLADGVSAVTSGLSQAGG